MSSANASQCPACANAPLARAYGAREYRTNDAFEIYECPACGLGVTRPELSLEKLGGYYAEQYYGSRKGVMGGIIHFLWMRKVARAWRRPPARLLDVGCGSGSFMKAAAACGWDVFGTELAPDTHIAADIAPRVCRGDLRDCPFEDGSFDVITLWHSFEHLQAPEAYVRKIRSLLKADGMLVIEVPNYRSWQARLFKADWLHLDVPRHLFHFSPESLEIILRRNGFAVARTEFGNPVYDLFGFFQSALNAVSRKKNIVFDALNGKAGGRAISVSDAVRTALLSPLAALLAVVLWAAELVCRRAGTVTVFAKREEGSVLQ